MAVRLLPPGHPALAQGAVPVQRRGVGGGEETLVEEKMKECVSTQNYKISVEYNRVKAVSMKYVPFEPKNKKKDLLF